MSAVVTAVCLVHTLLPEVTNPDRLTAIDKRAVGFAVQAGPLGLAADLVKDFRHHGGIEQAVYLYADEDAAWWAAELGREISPGLFGENLRSSGLDVSGAEIGQRMLIGQSLVVEVTSPRIPCATFQRRVGEPHWVKRFTEHGAPGAYLAVVEPGPVAAGDAIEILAVPGHGVSIADVFLTDDAPTHQRLLDAEAAGQVRLYDDMRSHARTVAGRG